MEEKSAADKDLSQESIVEQTERMESDEVLSGSDTPEVTENTDSTGDSGTTDVKPETSKTPSEPTSGIEIISGSTLSTSEVCDGASIVDAEKSQKPSSAQSPKTLKEIASKQAVNTEVVLKSASGIPCEIPSDDKPVQSEHVKTEVESASEKCAKAESLVAESAQLELPGKEGVCASEEIPCTGADRVLEHQASSEQVKTEIDMRTEKASDIQSEVAKGSISAEKMDDQPTVSTKKSTPPKKFKLSKYVDEILSPSKSKASRSKSMSPSEKSKPTASNTPVSTEETKVSEEKKEKQGFLKKWTKRISKFSLVTKSCASESANLISDEEIERSEDKESKPNTNTKVSPNADQHTCNIPVWIDNSNRSSLSFSDKPSWAETNTTDIPSTLSDADALPTDSSRMTSESGENTSQEAVAGSLASSPDEQTCNIKQDKDGEKEDKKDATETVAGPLDEKIPKEEPCSEESVVIEETESAATGENCPEKQSYPEDNAKDKEEKS